MLLVAYPVYNHGGRFDTAEPEVKLGISPAKTPRPQRSENNNKQFFQDNLSFLRNLACFAPWRESSLLIASFMSVPSFKRHYTSFFVYQVKLKKTAITPRTMLSSARKSTKPGEKLPG